jgi:hypothetical protein
VIEPRDEQTIFNGIKALGTLRMTFTHFVKATIRVCEKASSAHGSLRKNEEQGVRFPVYHDTCTHFKG